MLEASCHPFSRCLCRMIAADPCLHILFEFAQRNPHALSMCLAYCLISANEPRQRYALRSGKSGIPCCAMRHGRDCFSALVHIFPRGLIANKLVSSDRMLAVGESCEALLLD